MTHEHHANWTPKLEELIEAYAVALTSVTKDTINPESSTTRSLLRGAFKSKTKVQPLLKKICSEAGIDYRHYQPRVIIRLAEQNSRPDLAEILRKNDLIADKVNKVIASNGLRAIKKAGIKF